MTILDSIGLKLMELEGAMEYLQPSFFFPLRGLASTRAC